MGHTFPDGASNYYDVEKAKEILNKSIPSEYEWWRCVLCGFPRLEHRLDKLSGAYPCSGCGQTTMRPIAEYGNKE